MKVSVLMPVCNGGATIEATLKSVLEQTAPADEILVMNDGSTDDTAAIVSSHRPQVTLLSQPNGGVASARNALCQRAQGDILAFLDADDIWHPEYLKVQRRLLEEYPSAVASYTGHLDFYGYDDYLWPHEPPNAHGDTELMTPLQFLVRYNRATGPFASMSYCCTRSNSLRKIGDTPFRVDGVDDSYLACALALAGPVIYAPKPPLVAYRVTPTSFSADRLKMYGRWVQVFELMKPLYEASGDSHLLRAFKLAFASKRRAYSKLLLGANQFAEAREQLRRSLEDSSNPASIAKSLTLLSITYLPTGLHPAWPPRKRQWKGSPS